MAVQSPALSNKEFLALNNLKDWEKVREDNLDDIFGEEVWELVDDSTVGTLLVHKDMARKDADSADKEEVAKELEDFKRYVAFVQGYKVAVFHLTGKEM